MNLHIVQQALIRQHGLPPNFAFYKWEILQRENPFITQLTGGICVEKRKKKPYLTLLRYRNWKGRDKSKDRTFYVTGEQAEQIEREYIEQTGLCPQCEGERVTLASCGVLSCPPFRNDGEGSYTTYRTCSKCKGSGDGGAK